jgi:hypothetical protein
MPAIDTVTGGGRKPAKAKATPRPKAKAAPKYTVTVPDAQHSSRTTPARSAPRVRVTVPDAHHPSRTTRPHPVTPDQADRERGVATKAHDRQVTARVVREQREKAVAKAGRGSGTRAVKAFVKQNLHDQVSEKTKDIHGHHGSGKLAVITANLPIAGVAGRTFVNAAKDAAELAVTTPSSVAKLASDVVHHPGKVPGELAAPYVEFAKHPVKFSEEKPVTTALMLQPAGRMPGRVLGKAARVTGHQTLERPAATLPGTAVKEARTGSRDFFVRRSQAKKDAANPTPTVTAKEVQRRVDEHFDQSKHEARRIESATVKATRKATKGQPKDVRREAETQAREHARAEAQRVAEERFAREFGAVDQVTPQGHVVTPKNPTEGTLHDTRKAALKVASRLNTRAGAAPTDPMRFVVRKAGPGCGRQRPVRGGPEGRDPSADEAPEGRLEPRRHGEGDAPSAVARSRAPSSPSAPSGSRAGRRSGHPVGCRRRGAAGPDALPQGRQAPERAHARRGRRAPRPRHRRPLRPDRPGPRLRERQEPRRGVPRHQPRQARGRHDPRRAAPPMKAVRQGWGHYTHVVLGAVNGAIEQTARKAMAGQAIKNSPLMEKHIVGLSDKALEDAAKGLRGTHNQVALGRAVDRMYGQYQKFSPEKRSLLLHWSPFLPWYLNTATFLTKVLPVDHPVQAALLANISAAEEEWRKSHDLSLLQANHVPDFLLGSAPNGKGGYQRIAHYTPFGVGSDLTGSAADLMLPQFVGPLKNFGGVDWKWQRLTHGGKHGKEFNLGEKFVRAVVTAAEEQIPGVSQAGKITGLTPRFVDKDTNVKSPKEVLKGYLPTTATSNGQPPATTSGGSSGRVKVPGVTVPAG